MKAVTLRVGIIGPTDLSMLAQFVGRSREELVERGTLVGRILARAGVELWVVADGGMLDAVASGYKEHDGPNLVILLPRRGAEWPIDHALPYAEKADEVRRTRDWVTANVDVVTEPDLVVCVGLSPGTYSEFAYIRWNIRWPPQERSMRELIVIKEFIRGGELPPEHRGVLRPVLRYIDKAEQLRLVIRIHQRSRNPESSS